MLHLKIPSFAIYCKNELCTNEMHAAEITKFYQDITHVLLTLVIGTGNQLLVMVIKEKKSVHIIVYTWLEWAS